MITAGRRNVKRALPPGVSQIVPLRPAPGRPEFLTPMDGMGFYYGMDKGDEWDFGFG